MARVTVISNQKGGVGKTTTAHALAAGLTYRGYKVLAVDTDPQGNLSYTVGADDQKSGIYEVLKEQAELLEVIQQTDQTDIIPSTLLLASADLEFTDTGREYLLNEALTPVKDKYDYIIIDTPPTLGIITINALTAADDVIIPMGADIYSLQGLSQLYNITNRVKKYCNSELHIVGLLITRFNGRSILSKELKDIIGDKAKQINAALFDTVIREGVAIKESQTQQASIFKTSPKSNPAKDYSAFIDEYLKGGNLN